MLVSFRSLPGNIFKFLAVRNHSTNFPQTLTPTLNMGNESRPMCPSCSKPTRLCLCTRMKTPVLENSVAVTILQHSLEKNHPLNSTRIARLGLKNLTVECVSDVNFQARFDIHMLQLNCEVDSVNSTEKVDGFCGTENHNSSDLFASSGHGSFLECPEERRSKSCISFTIEKNGVISSINHQLVPVTEKQNSCENLLSSLVPLDAFRKGFVVKKLQTKQFDGGILNEESEEFELEVPPGSLLLFPSERSVGAEEINFEVKNLIVLDGTWAKATRMYNENPWLKLLPHLKLDLDRLSLYNEVRSQPRAGYLSTIESIVYALKAVGDNHEGLDGLLDVFESMVADQRRCKEERLSKVAKLM